MKLLKQITIVTCIDYSNLVIKVCLNGRKVQKGPKSDLTNDCKCE